MKYSKIVKRSGRMFRYNYERGLFDAIAGEATEHGSDIYFFRTRDFNWIIER